MAGPEIEYQFLADQRRLIKETYDLNDPEQLKACFLAHPNFSVSTWMMITGFTRTKLYKLRLRLVPEQIQGTNRRTHTAYRKQKRKSEGGDGMVTLDPPPEGKWTDENWLRYANSIATSGAIADYLGISGRAVRRRLREVIGQRAQPHKNKQWIYEHYINQKKSIAACATLAGVPEATFRHWMTTQGIVRRAVGGCTADYYAQAVKLLLKQPIVRFAKRSEEHIEVKYYSGVTESYWFGAPKRGRRSYEIGPGDVRLAAVPPVIVAQESGLDETISASPALLGIASKPWKQASFLERRLAVHEFLRQTILTGWHWPRYTRLAQRKALLELSEYAATPNLVDNVYSSRRRGAYYFPLLAHYFDLSDLWFTSRYLSRCMAAIATLEEQERNIDYCNLLQQLKCYQPRLLDPAALAMILAERGILKQDRVRILDLSPGIGLTALACAPFNVVYMTTYNERVRQAFELGFGELTNLLHYEYDGSDVDLVIGGNSDSIIHPDDLFAYRHRAKHLALWVPARLQNSLTFDFNAADEHVYFGHQLNSRAIAKPEMLFLWH